MYRAIKRNALNTAFKNTGCLSVYHHKDFKSGVGLTIMRHSTEKILTSLQNNLTEKVFSLLITYNFIQQL